MAVLELAERLAGKVNQSTKPLNTPEEQKILGELNRRYLEIKDSRIPFERQWYLNLAFFFGRHYVTWLSQANINLLYEPKAPSYRVRLVSNKCKTVIRTELAKMLKEKPRGYVVPNSRDDADKIASIAAASLYEAFEQPGALGMPLARRTAYFWTSVLGNGFLKQSYDKDKIDFTGKVGSLVVEALSPYSIYPADTLEPEIENQEFIIQVGAKPVAWVNETYGKNLTADSTSSMAAGSTVDQRFILALGMNQQPTNNHYLLVKEIWIKPCVLHPKGFWAMFTDTCLLDYKEEFPYKHGQYPYTKIDSIVTGRFWNDSILVDFIPLQKEYNKSISQVMETRNAMSKPGWVVQKGSVTTTMITNQPGQLIEYLPGTNPPAPVTPPSIPSYVGDLINRIQQDMNDTSGQHEITKGAVPTGVTAATAISYLQEEDDSKLAPTISSIEEGVQKTASQLLSLFAQYVNTERAIKIVGDSGAFDVAMYKSSTLKGNTDYRVEPGSAMPRSKAARQAFILELQERGVIDEKETLRYLDMSETAAMFDDSQKDTRQAERENIIMQKTGQTLPVNNYDNNIVHFTVHQAFQKTEQYASMPDAAKQAFEDHVLQTAAQVAAMYGRMDLIPQPIVDPMTQQPIIDQMTGRPKMAPTNPALYGFIETVKLHGPPPPIPPPMVGNPQMPGAGAPVAPQGQ